MAITVRNVDRALLVLRLAVAIVFIVHGYAKLFVMGHAGVAGFFTQLGIPLPDLAAWCVALLEFGGGIALALGIFTRALALLFVANMLGAIYFAVFPKGFLGGYELEFLLAATSLSLALAGGGAYSVDARLASRAAS
jgi:putative oxidoreductase